MPSLLPPERAPLDAAALIDGSDVLLLTIDTLRYDVAVAALEAGETPRLAVAIGGAWEMRHTPASFTYAAHTAFFAGFLPTPTAPGPHPRLFALAFPGSETIDARTCVLDAPDLVSGLRARGHHTICIGGTGFFDPRTPLGRVLPSLFDESHWSVELGVTDPRSTEHQAALAIARLAALPRERRAFLFVNVSALHQPNRHYVPGATRDSPETQRAALAYVDRALGPLFDAMRARGRVLAIITSDHGTAYGEDGHVGHRIGHPVVWNVPYAEARWEPA
jgi:hypothetical protein